jgi:hypothetical protein
LDCKDNCRYRRRRDILNYGEHKDSSIVPGLLKLQISENICNKWNFNRRITMRFFGEEEEWFMIREDVLNKLTVKISLIERSTINW